MVNRATRRRTAVTVADVARAAEVSTATVSNALNGTGRLAPATRHRVRAIAATLGYPPEAGVRDPGTGRIGALALAAGPYRGAAWMFNQDAHFARVLATVTTVAHARGYALLALPSHHNRWRSLAADGVLLLESPPDDPLPGDLRAHRLPFVYLGRPAEPAAGDLWVDNDHEAGTRSMLEHLAAAGGRRVALLGGHTPEHYTQQCVRTYLGWCADRGQQPVVELAHADDFYGRAGADRLLAGADRPDAVYGIYDHLGQVLLEAAHRHRVRVPGDVMIACASDSSRYAATDPPLTTLGLDPDHTARVAVTMLIDTLEGRRTVRRHRVVPTRLHPRATTARQPTPCR